MTNDTNVTDEILTNYMTFLLSGFTIKNIEIKSDTIKGYMKEVNKYYAQQNPSKPFDKDSNSGAAKLLREQENFESDPDQREPLPDLT